MSKARARSAWLRRRGVILETGDFVETSKHHIEPADGRLGVLMVGLGAVASTVIAGVELIGAASPSRSVR